VIFVFSADKRMPIGASTRLADVLGVDLADAVRKKAQRNETRFPPKTC
jgi:hypothetical protein